MMRRYVYHWMTLVLVFQLAMLAVDLPGRWTDVAGFALAPILAALLAGITGSRRDFWVLLVLAAAPPLLDLVVPWHSSALYMNLVKVVLWSTGPVFLVARLFSTIYYADPVRHHELGGAVSIYLLLAYIYAGLYEAIYLYDPASLWFGDSFAGGSIGFGEILYFSFVTLATLGYGDVAPAHPATRTIAVAEAITGLLYMAILVARFVSLMAIHDPRTGGHSQRQRDPRDP